MGASGGSLDYDLDFLHPKVAGNGDIDYGTMKFPRDSNPNGIAPQAQSDPNDSGGPWLRLAVARGAYTKAQGGNANQNDRCEVRDPKIALGTPVVYSFDLRAERGFPVVDARCVCAQIKAPYYDLDNGSPLFALRIDRGRYVATIEHLYEAKDAPIVDGSEQSIYLSAPGAGGCASPAVRAFDHHVFGNDKADFKELQVRALLATDAKGLQAHLEPEFVSCTTGVRVIQESPLPEDIHEWWRFRIEVAPTQEKDADGILRLYVGKPGDAARLVATAYGELGHAGDADPAINTGPAPGEGMQYFKLGPYRDKWNVWGAGEAAIHVRNVQRRAWQQGAALRMAANAEDVNRSVT